MKVRFWFLSAMVVAAAVLRLLPHPPNFTPVAALALFGGTHFDRKVTAYAVPLLAMLLSDTLFQLIFGWGFHHLLPVVYLSFAAVVTMGIGLRERRTVMRVSLALVAAPTLFFLTTNFAVWATGSLYQPTAHGLLTCYAAALPFYAWSLAGCAVYSALLATGLALAEQRFSTIARA